MYCRNASRERFSELMFAAAPRPHHRLLGSAGLASAGMLLQSSRSCYCTGRKPVSPAGTTAPGVKQCRQKLVEWQEVVLQGICIGPKALRESVCQDDNASAG
jgi:hypothetical protein